MTILLQGDLCCQLCDHLVTRGLYQSCLRQPCNKSNIIHNIQLKIRLQKKKQIPKIDILHSRYSRKKQENDGVG